MQSIIDLYNQFAPALLGLAVALYALFTIGANALPAGSPAQVFCARLAGFFKSFSAQSSAVETKRFARSRPNAPPLPLLILAAPIAFCLGVWGGCGTKTPLVTDSINLADSVCHFVEDATGAPYVDVACVWLDAQATPRRATLRMPKRVAMALVRPAVDAGAGDAKAGD